MLLMKLIAIAAWVFDVQVCRCRMI